MFIHLIILFIINNFCFSNDDDIYYMNTYCREEMKRTSKETYLNESNSFLLEIMRGKIPIKIEESLLNKFDLNLIKRINKNIPCLYIFRNNNYQINNTNGLFLGAGINLFNYDSEEIKEIIRKTNIKPEEKSYYMKLFNSLKEKGYKTILEFDKPFKELDKFNLAVMNYSINKYIKEMNDTKIYKSPFINGILSVYFQLFQGNTTLKRYLGYSQTQASYDIEHLQETSQYSRLIQSKLILMMDGNIKYNSNNIYIIVPLFLFEENDIGKIKELINGIYNNINNNYNLNPNRISILTFTKGSDLSNYIINYNNKKDSLDNIFKLDYKNKSEFVDLDKIYENINIIYKDNINQDLFENKIVLLFLNYMSNIPKNPENIIERYKKIYSIQSVPVINIGDSKLNNQKDIFKYNIFYNFSETIYVSPLKLAISNMHINIDYTDKNVNEKKLKNLNINDNDSPMYIEVNIINGTELEYYEISLEIYKTSGYNIFISDKNPYPSIRNYVNNFLKYENNLNPILIIKTANINKFYIGIEGILYFNIIIKKKYCNNSVDYNNLNLNKGEYQYVNYTYIKYQFKDKHLAIQTFYEDNNDIKLYSNIFKNESIGNIMKYFTRGIDIDNTNDISFLNYELFLYLYGKSYLINRVYKDGDNNYYFGRYFQISDYTPFQLKSYGFSRLSINKLYSFLNIKGILYDRAPSVSFNEDELKLINNIIYEKYVTELIYKIERYPNCIPFENQTPFMKFIIFCLYFTYYYENGIFRNIINLSSNEPKYSEVLEYLKDKNEESDIFLINYISQLEQENKLEKKMVSILLGKSLALSYTGINFIKNFSNYMSKSKTKISISVYDTSNNKIENVIPFWSTNNFKLEEITEYNSSSYKQRNKYNNTQNMNFDKIINFSLSQFSKYDNGIKKKLLILCDENISEGKNIINNKLINLNNKKHNELINNQIDLLLLTSLNYEKGEIHDLFKKTIGIDMPYSLYENYFHISNLNKEEEYLDDLGRIINYSPIKINAGTRVINDFNQGKITYYEINYQDYLHDVIVIKTKLSNFKFYSSLTNPFPNSNLGNPIDTSDYDDAIVISNEYLNGRIYLGLEPKHSVQKQKIEIFTCESYSPDKNCKFVGNRKDLWYLFFLLLFVFSLIFIIYKCKLSLSTNNISKRNKRLNVFDNIK